MGGLELWETLEHWEVWMLWSSGDALGILEIWDALLL